MSDLPWLDDAMDAYREKPERVEYLFIAVYAIAIGNCMRAMGHWPEREDKK